MKRTLIELTINRNDRFDPLQLMLNVYENSESERRASMTQIKLISLDDRINRKG